MSRSYKKYPVVNDSQPKSTKARKKIANRKVRNTDDVPNGKAYKKVSESWNIRDFAWFWSWEEALKGYEENEYLKKRYPTIDEFHRFWLQEAKCK